MAYIVVADATDTTSSGVDTVWGKCPISGVFAGLGRLLGPRTGCVRRCMSGPGAPLHDETSTIPAHRCCAGASPIQTHRQTVIGAGIEG